MSSNCFIRHYSLKSHPLTFITFLGPRFYSLMFSTELSEKVAFKWLCTCPLTNEWFQLVCRARRQEAKIPTWRRRAILCDRRCPSCDYGSAQGSRKGKIQCRMGPGALIPIPSYSNTHNCNSTRCLQLGYETFAYTNALKENNFILLNVNEKNYRPIMVNQRT